jgi:hypothetical protein
MLTRRIALSLAALTALATLPVLAAAAPVGAFGFAAAPEPASRGQAPGEPEPPDEPEAQDDCPTELWTVPLEVKGLLCLLVLPKPDSGEESGGLLG